MLKIAYDGTEFFGFARQCGRRTVQGLLEERLAMLLRNPVGIVGAGRTDRGVHAAGQVVSFDAPPATQPDWVMKRLNRWLAPEIAVVAAAAVPDDFSARFSAVRRSYEYRCYAAPARDPFQDRFALWLPAMPSVRSMRAGARALIGEHDFSSFCRHGEGPLTRRVRRVSIAPPAAGRLVFRVEADSFCHQMVRSIVGMLLAVGDGARVPGDVAAALAARDRAAAGPVADPRGLTLVSVSYRPDPFRHAAVTALVVR